MNRSQPSGAVWPRHRAKARKQRRRRESHGRTPMPYSLNHARQFDNPIRQQLDPKDYQQ